MHAAAYNFFQFRNVQIAISDNSKFTLSYHLSLDEAGCQDPLLLIWLTANNFGLA
jgi:hypothetical protein